MFLLFVILLVCWIYMIVAGKGKGTSRAHYAMGVKFNIFKNNPDEKRHQ